MEIREDILRKYFTQAAIEQIIDEYSRKGYKIDREKRFDNLIADVVATKADETYIFEIKSGEWNEREKDQIRKLRNKVVHEIGGKFILVFANPPKVPEIYIDDLDIRFIEYISENLQSKLNEYSTHTIVDEVTDIEFDSLLIYEDKTQLKGIANVGLGLQFGSDGDTRRGDGVHSYESAQLHFHVILNGALNIEEVIEMYLE